MPIDKKQWVDAHFGKSDKHDLIAHVYVAAETTPRRGQASYLNARNKDLCCAAMWGTHRYLQCSSKAKYEFEGLRYCGVHYPPKGYARNQARDAADEKRRRHQNWRWDHERWETNGKATFERALRLIAEGRLNDPVGYAKGVIDQIDSQEPKEPQG